MITVIHFENGRTPEIHFGTNEAAEKKIIRALVSKYDVRRATEDEWFGQQDPRYSVHHWIAK